MSEVAEPKRRGRPAGFTREAYTKRVIVTTESKPPKNNQVRIIDSDPNNLVLEYYKDGEWVLEGYYSRLKPAVTCAIDLVAKNAEFKGILSAIEEATKSILNNIKNPSQFDKIGTD